MNTIYVTRHKDGRLAVVKKPTADSKVFVNMNDYKYLDKNIYNKAGIQIFNGFLILNSKKSQFQGLKFIY